MKHILALTFLLLGCFCATAQNEKPPVFSLWAKWAPLALFEANSPTLQPGVGFIVNDRFGVHAEYGFHFNPFNWDRANQKNGLTTNRIRTELRYYTANSNNKKKQSAFFIAIEGFWMEQNYQLFNGKMLFPNSNQELYYDTVSVARTIKGFSVKGGYEIFLDKRKKFLFETSGGLGYRQRRYKHSNIKPSSRQSFLPVIEEINDLFGWTGVDTKEGPSSSMHLSFTIRLGYRIF